MPEDNLDVCCYRKRLPDVIVARLAGEGGGERRYVPEGRCEDLEKANEAWRHECDELRLRLDGSRRLAAELGRRLELLRELAQDMLAAGGFDRGDYDEFRDRMHALGATARDGGRDEGDAPTDIAVLGLPARTYHRLRRSGVHTVGQLAAMSDRELLAIRDLGPGRVGEVRERLAAYRAGKGEG